MSRFNLRLRLTAAITLVCLAGVALLGMLLYHASERMELALVEQLVGEELEFLVQRHAADPLYQPGTGPHVEYYILRPGDNDLRVPGYLRDLGAGQHEIFLTGESAERDVLIRDVDGVRYAVVYNIGPYEEREREFRQLVLLLLGVIVCLAPLLGYWLAGFLTRQLTLLAGRVATLAPDSPHAPLTQPGQDSEVAKLAQAFDQYHALFIDMITREQEFTANVSHELRTPLTAISTSCELLAGDPGLSEKSQLRVRQVRQAVNAMTDKVGTLLLLARGRQFDTNEYVPLRECVQDVLAPFADDIAAKALVCDVDVAAYIGVLANRQALSLVLSNLIGNAVRFTDNGSIRITFKPGRLAISDTGIGIAAEHLTSIFERSYRSERRAIGLGLGLDIVRRVCDRCGWRIEVASVAGAGSTFTLYFG